MAARLLRPAILPSGLPRRIETMPSPTLPIVDAESQAAWAKWLGKNHAKSSGVWLPLAEKGEGTPSVNYDEAIEEALCVGWIDGQKKGYDETAWLQKMTPRGPRSIWSKI